MIANCDCLKIIFIFLGFNANSNSPTPVQCHKGSEGGEEWH
jgi:hypothetical protein